MTVIPAALFDFLADLRAHNDTPWFHANKDRYERHVREPCRAFVRAVAPAMHRLGAEADDARSGGSLAAQHRDRRFSPDGPPYWPHALVRFPVQGAGPRRLRPAFTLRIEADGARVLAGLGDPGAELRRRIHDGMADPAWRRLRQRLDLDPGRMLHRPADDEDLRRRDFIASVAVPKDTVIDEAFPRTFGRLCRDLAPLNRFLASRL